MCCQKVQANPLLLIEWGKRSLNDKYIISPSNYYNNWSYQNEKGEIISNKNIEKSIKNTREFYATYNILTTKDSISNKTIFSFLPNNLKKNIKRILSKFFPLDIG